MLNNIKLLSLFIAIVLAHFDGNTQNASFKPIKKLPNVLESSANFGINNLSDSAFTVRLPQSLFYEFHCEAIENLEAEAKKLNSLKNEILSKTKAVIHQCENDSIYINEGIGVEEKYFTLTNHFNIWDSKNVDPYHIPLKNFNHTVNLKLYDKSVGQNWSVPVKKTKINSKYGMRWYRWHHGIDLDLNIGDPVYAAFDGVVRIAKYNRGGYGYYVMIRHDNGLETLYGHLKKYTVKVGDKVKAGQEIGLGGNTGRSTGPHLHFETRYQGHAFDPRYIFDFQSGKIHFANFFLSPIHYQGLLASTQNQYHKVRRGDSLWVLSRRYRTSISQLCRLNGISRNSTLRIGKLLRVR